MSYNTQEMSEIYFSSEIEQTAITDCLLRVTACATQLFTSPLGIQGNSYEKTGQGGQLKTIFPEIFFDLLTGGPIFNP